MKKIVYTRPDGGISIVSPAPAAKLPSETEDEFLARIVAKDVPVTLTNPPAGISQVMQRSEAIARGFVFIETPYQIVDAASIPTDRTNRDAWEWQP